MGFRICFEVKFDKDKVGPTRFCEDLPVLIIKGWKFPPPPPDEKPRPDPLKLINKLSPKTKNEIATLVALDETAKGLSPSGRKKFQAQIEEHVLGLQKLLPAGMSIEYAS